MEHQPLNSILEFAITAVHQAKTVAVKYLANELSIERKYDGTFVSDAEKAIETSLRDSISKYYPEHGIIGEEYGFKPGVSSAEYEWTIDPIDGTRNFLAGLPTPPILLGLLRKNTPVLGVVCHPLLDLTVAGAKGCGVFVNGNPLVRKLSSCPEPIIFTGSRGMFNRTNEAHLFDSLHTIYPDAQVYLDAFSQIQSVLGHVDAVVEWNLKIWDYTPLAALTQETGGSYNLIRHSVRPELPDLYCSVMGKPEIVKQLSTLLSEQMKNVPLT